MKDLHGRYVAVNSSFERFVGIPREAAVGRTDSELFAPEIARAFRDSDLQVIASGRALQFEEHTDFAAGPRVCLTQKFPLFDDAGEIVATAGIVNDFTERVHAVDQLLASERRYAALFEHMHDAVVVVDDDGRYRQANPAALELLGRTLEETLQLRVGDVTTGKTESIRHMFRALLADGYANGEFTLRRRNGEICQAEFRAVANVMPGLHMIVVRDITARKQAEGELHESEERFRLLFESSPLPILALDIETRRFPFVNEAAVHLYGYTRKEFAILTAADICVQGNWAAMETSLDSLVRGSRFSTRMRHMKRNGEVIEVTGYSHVTEMTGRLVVLVSLVDKTARNRVRRQRDKFQLQLREVTRRLITLQEEERVALAGDLHDHVGQSLSALGIEVRMLQAQLADAPAGAREGLSRAASIVEDATLATRNVISALRPEALREFGLHAALRDFAATSWTRFHFDIHILAPDPGLRAPAAVEAALLRIAQEALANVAKHAHARRASIVYRRRPGGVVLHIADDGQGFAPPAAGRPSRWGMLMMRERAESVGALLKVRTCAGRGTDITVRWRDRRAHPRPAG